MAKLAAPTIHRNGWYKRTTDGEPRYVYATGVSMHYPKDDLYSRPVGYHVSSHVVPIKQRGKPVQAPYEVRHEKVPFGASFGKELSRIPVAVQERFRQWILEKPYERYMPFNPLTQGIKIGADPEIFVVDAKGEVIPAWEFLPPKNQTFRLAQQFWDGFQAEWTVEPQTCLVYLTNNVANGMRIVYNAATAKFPDARLTWQPVKTVSEEVLATAAREHVQLGCMPSKNIYEEFVPPIESGRELPLRFAGCHMHFGMTPGFFTDERISSYVGLMDAVAGVVVTSLLQGLERPERRAYYGRPGEYRVATTRFKLEYRVHSSAVLVHPSVWHFAFDLTRFCIKMAEAKYTQWDFDPQEVREALINLDIETCQKIIKKNEPMLRAIIGRIYGWGSNTKAVENSLAVITKGVKEFVSITPGCMETSWQLQKYPDAWRAFPENSKAQWQHFATYLPA